MEEQPKLEVMADSEAIEDSKEEESSDCDCTWEEEEEEDDDSAGAWERIKKMVNNHIRRVEWRFESCFFRELFDALQERADALVALNLDSRHYPSYEACAMLQEVLRTPNKHEAVMALFIESLNASEAKILRTIESLTGKVNPAA